MSDTFTTFAALTTTVAWSLLLVLNDEVAVMMAVPCDTPVTSPVEVTVDYAFRSAIPIVPIPPLNVQGASTLVINN